MQQLVALPLFESDLDMRSLGVPLELHCELHGLVLTPLVRMCSDERDSELQTVGLRSILQKNLHQVLLVAMPTLVQLVRLHAACIIPWVTQVAEFDTTHGFVAIRF